MRRWTELAKQRVSGAEPNTPWWVNDKFKLHAYCAKRGLPMPTLYESWSHPDEMDLEELPDEFVLKPSVMHSEWGVMVLRRLTTGNYYDSLNDIELSTDAIRKRQLRAFEVNKYKSSYRLLAEEKIVSARPDFAIPLDYKLYVFLDEVPLIQQINRNVNPREIFFFSHNFAPLQLDGNIESDWASYRKGTPQLPHQGSAMIAIAREMTSSLKTPFMRVDMFESIHGPVIGELTPAPGGAYYGQTYRFTEAFDRELGAHWLGAQSRLAADT